jgi:hypothetical protein
MGKLDEYDEPNTHINPSIRTKNKMDLATYNYYLETEWFNWATTNGWGAFNNSRNSLDTRDFDSGYGIKEYSSSGYSKKLKRIYIYNNHIYYNPYAKVIDSRNGNFINVVDAPGTKVKFAYLWD